ncbi:hypothetical protein [Bacillus sp. m3-13]|uniref:hypothetical protein n=1 Tax=Bacillus sp. m3-13 TaxID=406124 RepID=UPI0001E89E0C|nr:hypothetical protein [Bacillus sp. m3-13]
MKNHKKRILFFLFSLGGGGAERTVINIINNLDKERFDIVLVLGTKKDSDYMHLVDSHVRIIVLGSKKLRYCLFKLKKTNN